MNRIFLHTHEQDLYAYSSDMDKLQNMLHIRFFLKAAKTTALLFVMILLFILISFNSLWGSIRTFESLIQVLLMPLFTYYHVTHVSSIEPHYTRSSSRKSLRPV